MPQDKLQNKVKFLLFLRYVIELIRRDYTEIQRTVTVSPKDKQDAEEILSYIMNTLDLWIQDSSSPNATFSPIPLQPIQYYKERIQTVTVGTSTPAPTTTSAPV